MATSLRHTARSLTIALLSLALDASCSPHTTPVVVSAPPASAPMASAAAPPTQPAADLSFTIRREPRSEGYAIVVEARFDGDASGRTALDLPNQWGGQKELWREIAGLTALGDHTSLEAGSTPDKVTLVHPPGARVGVRYELVEKPEIKSVEHGADYRPLVQKAYWHFIGHALFVSPHWAEDADKRVAIEWRDFPADAHIANSFGVDERTQVFTASLSKLKHAVYVGGDFRVHEVSVRGKPVRVVMRGTWGFTDDELVDLVRKVVDAERAFFGDDDFDRFLVTLIPTGTECCSYGGTGLTDSFATFIASNLPVERRMKHLLAHELFHTWNGRRIQRQEPEELVYWFSEGLTDYYANLLSMRAGIVTFPEYVAEYDQTLRTYYLSTARNVPNETVRRSFWEDHAIERIPYQRGDILAHEWSLRIKRATPSASFDDVMRDLFHAAMTDGTVVSAPKIDELVRRYLPGGISDDIAHYIDRGDTIVPSAGALGPCVKLEQTKIGPFDLGFDEAKSSGSLVGVEPGGPAARAGAKEGMSLRHSRWSNDPTRKVELTVVDGKREKTISYLPQGKPVMVPQYRLDEVAYAKNAAACEAPLR